MEEVMNLPVILAIAGCAALLAGIFGGGVKAKEIAIPKLTTMPRIFSSLAGLVLIAIAIWISLPTPTAEVPPTQIPPTEASPAPLLPTDTPPAAATFTQQAPTPGPMVPVAATQIDLNSQAVYIHTVLDGNMSGRWSDIENVLSSDPEVLIFAMPNFNSPTNPRGVYNRDLNSVWYRGSQWALVNQEGNMPRDAAFNIQILIQGENAFVHKAASANITDSWTVIDHPLASDPNALVFAMPTWSVAGESMRENEHPIGVWYTGSQWAILNLDGAPMRNGAAFNVEILSPDGGAFIHTATPSNTMKNWTAIDNPLAFDEHKLVFVMPRGTPDGDGVNNIQPIGVWYTGSEWTIFNQFENEAMPVGAEFNILILDAK